jgi:hypothetical protein
MDELKALKAPRATKKIGLIQSCSVSSKYRLDVYVSCQTIEQARESSKFFSNILLAFFENLGIINDVEFKTSALDLFGWAISGATLKGNCAGIFGVFASFSHKYNRNGFFLEDPAPVYNFFYWQYNILVNFGNVSNYMRPPNKQCEMPQLVCQANLLISGINELK